jgi:hypothetical protein
MSKLSKEKQQKLLIVGSVTAVVVGVLWFVLISPLRGRLASLGKQKDDAREQVEKGKRTIALTPLVTNELAAVQGQLKTAEDKMAAGDLYDWMIQTMNRFKAAHAVQIPQISRETPGEVGMFPHYPYRAATFAIRGTAYYHDLGKYLAELENAFPYAQVLNLQLSSAAGPQSADDEHLQFSLDFQTLVKPVTP